VDRPGEIDAFVHCVGTAASSRGVATVLKRHKPSIRIVVVEGIGYAPPLWEPTLVDDILPVSTEDAKAMARRLARGGRR
jgi:cysteine synthase A